MTEVQKYTETRTFDSDRPMSIRGVPGRLKVRSVCYKTKVGCWENQSWVSERRERTIDGDKVLMHAEIRFDDNCHNGHNSFAITGYGWYDRFKASDWDFGGCCHDTIVKVFPELIPLIQWHLMDTDGPMHYVANTVYHASNRDAWGRLKGEPYQYSRHLLFGNSPIPVKVDAAFLTWLLAVEEHKKTTQPGNPNRRNYDIVGVPYVKTDGKNYQFSPKYTFDDFGTEDPTRAWYKAPFDSLVEAQAFKAAMAGEWRVERIPTAWGEGKERDFDAARRSAKWPEATDEQLSLPKEELTALLEARLPAMVNEFRTAMEKCGLFWSPEAFEEAQKCSDPQ